jgi:hypothetical protein
VGDPDSEDIATAATFVGKLSMPAAQGLGRNEERTPSAAGKQARQDGEDRPVC